MSDLKKTLIKLGSENPVLQDDLRPVLAEIEKESAKDLREKAFRVVFGDDKVYSEWGDVSYQDHGASSVAPGVWPWAVVITEEGEYGVNYKIKGQSDGFFVKLGKVDISDKSKMIGILGPLKRKLW